jgi:DNA-binding CsgD family transcriptional regulator/PAS domain-containing protein
MRQTARAPSGTSASTYGARKMRDDEQLTDLIGSIYDAALDPALWTNVLAAITDFVGGQAGRPLSALIKFGTVHDRAGFDPHSMRHWADAVTAVLEKSVTSCTYTSVMRIRESGMVDAAMGRRMSLVMAHVRRAVLIGKAMDHKQAQAATLADTLDGLSPGIFLIDTNGRIVHANSAGHDILGASDFLRSIGGRLVAGDKQVDRSLREAFAAAGKGDAEIGIKATALPLTACDGGRYVAHILPLAWGARRRAGMTHASAAVFVRKAALDTPSPPDVIAKTYNLTPTELRVLLAIVEIGGVPEVAASFGVADTTIKTHLNRVFQKTGATRQADLVKLVAGFSSLVAA